MTCQMVHVENYPVDFNNCFIALKIIMIGTHNYKWYISVYIIISNIIFGCLLILTICMHHVF